MNKEKKKERYLLGGTVVTNIADSLFYILTIWYFNQQFSSPIVLSLVFALLSIIDAFSFLLGPIIDRTEPKINLFFVSVFQTICVALLVLYNIVLKDNFYEHGIMLALCLILTYIGSAIIYPSGEKLIPIIVGEERIVQVNSLFKTCEKVLDIFFNAIATVIISIIKFDYVIIMVLCCLVISIRLYYLVCVSIGNQVNYKKEIEIYSVGEYINDLKIGILEVKTNVEIMKLFLPMCVVNLFYGMAIVGLPVVSKIYINDNAYGYGSLLAASSFGGMMGAMVTGRFSNILRNPSKYTTLCLTVAGAAWMGMTFFMPLNFGWSYLFIFISNCAINIMNIIFVSLLQKNIEITILGRASTFTESLVSIMIPIGNFMGGFLITILDPLVVEIIYGVSLLCCSLPYMFIKSSK